MALKFQDPPPDAKGAARKSKWREISDELRSRPGDWALVAEHVAMSMVTMIKNGRIAGMPAGEFEAVGRNSDTPARRCDVYARYVGGADA